MVKHTQTISRQKPTNCFSVFDHFVKLTLKGLKTEHCFNVFFDVKKQSFEKNTRESTVIFTLLKESKIDFFWTDDEMQLLLSSIHHLFSYLNVFAVIVVGPHHLYSFHLKGRKCMNRLK